MGITLAEDEEDDECPYCGMSYANKFIKPAVHSVGNSSQVPKLRRDVETCESPPVENQITVYVHLSDR